jgi:tetratricopeptide (TPR) repeat protein
MAQQAYDQAAVKYQAALNEAPNDIPIRYALAVVLSYLPRREETVEQFRTILYRGDPASFEVKAARDWLANAKELEGIETAGTGAATTGTGTSGGAANGGRVLGQIRWQDITPQKKMVRVNVNLIGEEGETRDVRLGREFKIGRVYEFREVPPSAYRLVAEVGGTPMWDMKVVVQGQKENTFDLTDGNAAVAKDFTPPSD